MTKCKQCKDGICTCEYFLTKIYGLENRAKVPENKGTWRKGSRRGSQPVIQLEPNQFEYGEGYFPIEPIEYLKGDDLYG